MSKRSGHENRIIVFNLSNVLESEGIATHLVNEWYCRGCGEKMDAAFRISWNCGKVNDEEAQ